TGLSMKDKTLLLLHASTRPLSERELVNILDYSNGSVYRRNILRPAHKNRLLEYDQGQGQVMISPSGIDRAEQLIADRAVAKAWGEPLLRDGKFTYPADVNKEQLERAKSDPNWRLEIVGNIAAVRAGEGKPERLTLTGREVVERAAGWRYRVPLDGLAERLE